MPETIGNPASWIAKEVKAASAYTGSVAGRVRSGEEVAEPELRRIEVSDLRDALRKGIEDFAAVRSDVAFLCILYPIIGACLAWLAFQGNLLPLLFPMVSGFALVGPVAAVGLYEMSRKRGAGLETSWADAFAVARSPSFGAVLVLGLVLMAVFVIWVLTANGIYGATLGPEPPASLGSFVREVLTTGAGWAMVVVGCVVGFFFAALVLAASVVSFPLLLDRDVGLVGALITSFRAVALNPRTFSIWGLIVAGSLALGSLPAFLGLIVVLPILGHSTWHLYRRVVVQPTDPDQV